MRVGFWRLGDGEEGLPLQCPRLTPYIPGQLPAF